MQVHTYYMHVQIWLQFEIVYGKHRGIHTHDVCYCMEASLLGRSLHVDTFIQPSMKTHTILWLVSDWFFYNPFSATREHLRHLTNSSLFILLQQGESKHVWVKRKSDWLALSLCDYLHFIQSGRCTGTKSSACNSHVSLILFKHPTHC